jgi:hypothetical protein
MVADGFRLLRIIGPQGGVWRYLYSCV